MGEANMTAKDKQSPVAVVVGSDSDLEVMQFCIRQLKEFGIEPQVRVLSAHRSSAGG
jgi:5-(carboxyamino)imidazole ribonucleotide mutase